jgi:DNA-binding response OmpR family regulator
MVFVIEDDVDTRSGLRDALESHGFVVFATGDGREALDHLRAAPRPDAMVLDLYMPGLSGFEIYRVLRDDPDLATIPIIVVTAASPAHRTGLDVAATIRKPLDVQELLFTVRRAIGKGTP